MGAHMLQQQEQHLRALRVYRDARSSYSLGDLLFMIRQSAWNKEQEIMSSTFHVPFVTFVPRPALSSILNIIVLLCWLTNNLCRRLG